MKIFTTLKFKNIALVIATTIGLLNPTLATAEKLIASQIEVNDDIVHLGDIFDVTGIFADEELFQSPPLGRKGSLTTTKLMQIAKKYNLDWQNEENFAKIYIQRKSKTVSVADLKQLIIDYATAIEAITPNEGQTQIKLADKFKPIVMAANEFAEFEVSKFNYRPFSDQFSIELNYLQAGSRKIQKLTGKIQNLVKVPVFARNIRRNEVILHSDIKYIQLNHRRVAENIVLDVADIIGKSARNRIRALQPISENLLKFADLVKKNTIINLQFKVGRVSLSIKARALATGAEGALIRVMNLKSGKQIDAIVTGTDRAMTINSNQTNAKIASNY